MWFYWDEANEEMLMTHTTERHNFRNVNRDPRVAVSIFDPDHPYRQLSMRGVVEKIVPDPDGEFYQQLSQRYTGEAAEVKDRAVRVTFHIHPTHFTAREGRPRKVASN